MLSFFVKKRGNKTYILIIIRTNIFEISFIENNSNLPFVVKFLEEINVNNKRECVRKEMRECDM